MTADKLYLVQHGLALNKAENPERPLSEAGIRQTRSIAKHLLASDITISSIFHSGKLRAQQTAGIIADVSGVKKIDAVDNLAPNDDVTLIRPQLNTDRAMYVGHLPHLEKLVSNLVAGDENAGVMLFQNSAVICLQRQDSMYRIAWYLTPQIVYAE